MPMPMQDEFSTQTETKPPDRMAEDNAIDRNGKGPCLQKSLNHDPLLVLSHTLVALHGLN